MSSATSPSRVKPSAAEAEAFKVFWAAYDKYRAQVTDATMAEVRRIPVFSRLIDSMTPAQLEEQQRQSRERQREALLDGNWEPYLTDLHAQGAGYARMGIPFPAWYELVSAMHRTLLPLLLADYGKDPARLQASISGMQRFLDIAMAGLGDAYLSTKEEIISQQQAAIRELTTPVLQVRERLLIAPLVGVIDTHRARQLTEDLLRNIRDRRARVVVIDITGVPIVDSKVANHLVQTVEAAGLMGAKAILTGISPEIAQTLVTIGADLKGVTTAGDLQTGIEAANKLLGVRVVPAAQVKTAAVEAN